MQQYVDFAGRLASASSEVILRYFQHELEIAQKADGSPVTIADRETERVMRQMITETYPEHGIVGEEFEPFQPLAPHQWVIDPIDGTVNFIAGSFLFGTLIALMQNGSPVLGVIHHPISRHLLIGAMGETRLNDLPVRVRPCLSIEQATICSSAYFENASYCDFDAFDNLISRCRIYRTWGDCHGYYLLATGGVDVVLDPNMRIWDIMALIPIVQGAGGRITDWKGGSALSGNGIIATAGGIHDDVVRMLNPRSS